MDEIETYAHSVLENFINKLIEDENYYYFYETLVDKQELHNQFDYQMVDDICEAVVEIIDRYLYENNLNGYCDNGYAEVCIVT